MLHRRLTDFLLHTVRWTVVCMLVLLAGASGASAQPPLRLFAAELAPLHVPVQTDDGTTYTGRSINILGEVMAELNRPFTPSDIVQLPWARALLTAQTTPHSLLIGVVRNPQREESFAWVGPYTSLHVGLIAKRSSNIRIAEPAQLNDLSIAAINDSSPLQLLTDEYGVARQNIFVVHDEETQYRMLAADRVDAITHTASNAPISLRKMGLDPNGYEMVFVLREVALYYALNPVQEQGLVEAMQRALDRVLDRRANLPPNETDDVLSMHIYKSSTPKPTPKPALGQTPEQTTPAP